MYNLNNLIETATDKVFNMTGFNYDIAESFNQDGTINWIFDCDVDLAKFKTLYKEVA